MKVTVKLFAVLKDVVKSGEVALDLPEGADIESLLENLSNEFGGDLEDYLIDEKTKKPRAYLQIMVDGKYTSFSEGKKTTLRDGSVVALLPPIGGGMENLGQHLVCRESNRFGGPGHLWKSDDALTC